MPGSQGVPIAALRDLASTGRSMATTRDKESPVTIVAEVCTNYESGAAVGGVLLSQKFEQVIEFNRQRGYELVDWRMSSVATPMWAGSAGISTIAETIVAIFRRREEEQASAKR